jgi:UDP-N-acetylmuramoyl-tripeptide--D-alanyl-D-alanine ligase
MGHLDYHLIKQVCSEVHGSFPITFTAKGISFDANKVEPGDIYVPIDEHGFDSHQLIEAAVEAGACATFWKKSVSLSPSLSDDITVFVVEDPMVAVKQLAEIYLVEVDPVKIAVVGDETRIAAKKVLVKLLTDTYNVHGRDRATADEKSVLETILTMPLETDALICDVDARTQSKVTKIGELLTPSISLIVVDDEGEEEALLRHTAFIEDGMKASGTIIVKGDHVYFRSREWKTDVFFYGENQENMFHIEESVCHGETCTFSIKGIRLTFQLPSIFSNHIKLITSTIAASVHLGIDADHIKTSLRQLNLRDIELAEIGTVGGTLIVCDTFGERQFRAEYGVKMLKQLGAFQRRVLIIDDGFRGEKGEKMFHETAASLVAAPISDVLTIGDKAFWVAEALKRRDNDKLNYKHYVTHSEAIIPLKEIIEKTSLVLYRGANRELIKQLIKELNRH